MAETKIVKGYCKRTKRYYAFDVAEIGGKYKVVNTVQLSPEEASLVASEVDVKRLETHTMLIACEKCGNRTVGGCDCAKKRGICDDGRYRFDCLYCKEMQIDNSLPTYSGGGHREGDMIQLSQGQVVKIRYADNKPANEVVVGVGWDPAPGAVNMDIDSSVFLMNDRTGACDTVCFWKLTHPSGAVVHGGDNLTGENEDNSVDDENIFIHLKKVPAEFDRLVFVVNIYKAGERNQTLNEVRNFYIRLDDPDSKKAIMEYRIDQCARGHNALVIGTAYRDGQDFCFKAIGKSLKADTIDELSRKCVSLL